MKSIESSTERTETEIPWHVKNLFQLHGRYFNVFTLPEEPSLNCHTSFH